MSRLFSVFNVHLKNHYEVLGVSKNATQSDIKAAYYKLSKMYHPDKNQTETAVQEFRNITEAYEVIGNYKMRKMYDRGLLGTVEADNSKRTYTVYHQAADMNKPSYHYKSSAYNFDEWTQAHYGESFNRRAEAKSRYEEKIRHDFKTDNSKNENVIVSVFSVLAACLLFKMLSVDNLDEVKVQKNNSNNSSRNP